MKPTDIYQQRKSQFKGTYKEIQSRSKSIASLRVLLFLAFLIGFVLSADKGSSLGLISSLIIFLVLFFVLLRKHSQLKRQTKLFKNLVLINEDEVRRLNHDLKSFEEGNEYFDPTHPYHIDVDVFGRHSLYQLLNRTSSLFGSKTLAQWLSEHVAKSEIIERQDAVRELTDDIDFRQQFEAYGKIEEVETEGFNVQTFFSWLNEKTEVKNAVLYKSLMLIFGLGTLTSIVLAAINLAPVGLPILLIFINIGILSTLYQKLMTITQKTKEGHKSLSSLKDQLKLIEDRSFNSPKLSLLKEKLTSDNNEASGIIKDLSSILNNLQNRANVMYLLLNSVLLLDIYWYLKVMSWKKQHEEDLEAWFYIVAQFDTISSIASYAYSHPDFNYPEISEDPCHISAKKMGHPLIKRKNRVTNNFDFSDKGSICLITGSNMSGKSTFLRTVATNSVLALMGGPVCAEVMKIGELKVFTSMRTQDDLEESVSSFYAELKRLKQLIEQVDESRPTLFMIDEVLKGTNSDDRHKGAIALIKQLNQANAFGLVSTHDIVLGNITNELNGVKNYSFNSQIVGDEIKFDYKLTPGICESFNATKLMQLMGIQVK